MMKTYLLATVLALAAVPAVAGEGNGEPYALNLPAISTTMVAGTVGSSQNPFPYTARGSNVHLTAGRVGSSQNPFPFAAATTAQSFNPATVDTQHATVAQGPDAQGQTSFR